MYSNATVRVCAVALAFAGAMAAQVQTDWRHVGNSLVDRGLAGLATGPAQRVWFGDQGAILVRTAAGLTYWTLDLEHWQPVVADPPIALTAVVKQLPEPAAITRAAFGENAVAYAFGTSVYRSDNGGASWDNLTTFRGASVVGEGLHDLAVSPANSDEIVVAGDAGVFRSVDGGKSWIGLNDGLPNLSAQHILSTPSGTAGVTIALSDTEAAQWAPGEKQAWRLVDAPDLVRESQLKQALSLLRGAPVSAVAIAGDFVYSGLQSGEILVSSDRGITWRSFVTANGGPVERFWIDPNDPRIALAAFGASPLTPVPVLAPAHVFSTTNGGAIWDNIATNLPDVAAYGVTADPSSGAIYAATAAGVWMTYTDPANLSATQLWTPISGAIPAGVPARDVMLDPQGNQLWAAIEGYGVYATLAPHRLRDPRVVSAADLLSRAAAPGSLVSILGAPVDSARTGGLSAPVLASTGAESQIQIPFNVPLTGNSEILPLAISSSGGNLALPPLTLTPASPAIFVDRDGSPLLIDAESGVMLDAMTAAHSNARIQILATGLGRVTPDWIAGVPAPTENPPKVAGAVHAYLDRAPVEVTRAVLAPGYIGFYLIEVTVPKIVNYGPAELYIDVNGTSSNRVRVYIEP